MERKADLLGSDPYPGESPEADILNDRARRDYTLTPDREPVVHHWAATPTHVSVGDSPEEVQAQLQIDQLARPHAAGLLHLRGNYEAAWQVGRSNMALGALEKRLRRYTSDQDWKWDSISDSQGEVLNNAKEASVPGVGEINPGVKDWRIDEWSGTEQYDNPGDRQSDTPFYGLQDYDEDFPMTQPRTCSECGALCLDYDDWRKHILDNHVNRDRAPSPDPQPVVDLDDVLPAGFNEAIMDKTVQRQSRLIHQLSRAAVAAPSIAAPMPFIYDIEQDRIFVGHPGERHADIEGRVTPGGVVEGVYDPKGHVQIRTDTDMPYTVRHMVQLWYAMHPELEVKSIYLMVGDQRMKLASANIGNKVRNLLPSDPAAYAAFHALRHYGEVYAVGGAVRDAVLGVPPKDIDLLVVGAPEDLVREALSHLPGRVDLTGQHFGVFRYRDKHGGEVEVALPRTERSTGPGHRDFEVYTDPYIDVEDDLLRRDFTGNAMAVNLSTGELVDPFGGAADLKRGALRTVSDRSFAEDPLRILRALVAASRHELAPDEATERQMAAEAPTLRELPAERVQAELEKVMAGTDPVAAFELAQRTGVLGYVLPEVADTHGFDQQNKWHNLELFDHIMAVLGHVSRETNDPDIRWAALLHDIGKPASQWIDEDGFAHYYRNEAGEGAQHEEVGADMARDLMRRLKFPNDRIDRVGTLVRWHMYPPFESAQGARRFVNKVGDGNADDLLTLRWADSGGKDPGNPKDGSVNKMRQLVRQVRERAEPTDQSMLAVNGKDLIDAGIKPGPEMGQILRYLTEQVVGDPSLNEKGVLLTMALDTLPGEPPPWSRTSNILDPVKTELDPDVFDRAASAAPDVKASLCDWATRKVHKALVGAGWPDPSKIDYLTLTLTGSLTTYQWGPESDFDVSVWVKTDALPEWVRADLIKLMIEECDSVIAPGTTHPLQCFVVDSRKYQMSDLFRPGVRSAYDLDKRRWIVYPERQRSQDVYKNYPGTIAYARSVEDKIRMMLRYGNDDALRTYWNFIHHQRQRDMARGKGDYAESNIVYKWLVRAGLLPEIAKALGVYLAT